MQHRNPAPQKARQGLFLLTQSANALETLASRLDALANHYDRTGSADHARMACLLSETAEQLAFHADAIREGSGLNALTQENIDELKRAL